MDLHDVGVVQSGDGLGLHSESVVRPARAAPPIRDDLDGHMPLEIQVVGQIDDTHAAPAELAQDFVARDGGRLGRIHSPGRGRINRRPTQTCRSQHLAQFKLLAQLLAVFRKTPEEIGQVDHLPLRPAKQHVLVDQINDRLGIGPQFRVAIQYLLDRNQITVGTVRALLIQQAGH
jgi:hypothetical protein